VAKNTILKRAIEGNSQWEVVGDKLESSNMWFFVGSDMKVGRERGRGGGVLESGGCGRGEGGLSSEAYEVEKAMKRGRECSCRGLVLTRPSLPPSLPPSFLSLFVPLLFREHSMGTKLF